MITKSDGRTYYITGEGVAKLYGSASGSASGSESDYSKIIGKNNCPTTTEQIDSMPSYINTIDGTNMIVGQQCGNEGKNVRVDKMISNSGSTYIGCYNDLPRSPAMTPINKGLQNYNFTSCKQMSMDTGNLYFGLQNLNPTTKKSACYVSNDYDKTTKYSKTTSDNICVVNSEDDNNKYGVNGINAVYKMNESGNPSYMGKMGYIDSNSKLFEYPSSMIIRGINYSNYVGYGSSSKTLKTMEKTTPTACIDECDKDQKYYGFVFDKTNEKCYLKGSDILKPTLKKMNTERDLYIRDFKINGADPSCNKEIIPIDSNQWYRYNKGSQQMSSITTCSSTQQLVTNSTIAHLERRIAEVALQITNILSNLQKQNADIRNDIIGNEYHIETDLNNYNNIMLDIQNYKKNEPNMNNIVKDTNLLVLYQNYNYMFWSILAISTVIISMKMVGK